VVSKSNLAQDERAVWEKVPHISEPFIFTCVGNHAGTWELGKETETMQKSMIKMLNGLVNRCEDAREFYTSAARQTKNEELKDIFRKMASTRESIIINLKTHANSLASELDDGGTLSGQASNIFKLLKARVGNTDISLVTELEAAENKTLKEFQNALESNPPETTRSLIERQMRILTQTHNHMKYMKEKLNKAA
tara:strand:+ start:63005 stop:63586 length:582 start_codon:yes stop_codon:yes gene_type:complete